MIISDFFRSVFILLQHKPITCLLSYQFDSNKAVSKDWLKLHVQACRPRLHMSSLCQRPRPTISTFEKIELILLDLYEK